MHERLQANESAAAETTGLGALARELGNISEACRRLGVDRSAYYRERMRETRAAAAEGEGPVRAGHAPRKTADAVVKRLLTRCLEYPEWGCDRLAHYLTLTGDPISSPTAQKILIRHGLGRYAQRLAACARRAP